MIKSEIEKQARRAARIRWIVMVISILVVFFSVFSSFLKTMPDMNGRKYVEMKSDISVDIIHADGRIDYDLPPEHWMANQGDRVEMNLSLPDTPPYKDSYLIFYEYNCLTEFSIDGQPYEVRLNGDENGVTYTEYLEKELEDTYMIGNIQYIVPIPDNAWGSTLTVILRPQENKLHPVNSDFYLMPAADVRYQPLLGHEAAFFMYICAIVASCVGCGAGVLRMVFMKRSGELLLVSLFVLFISSWYFGRYHLLYLLFTNVRLCAKIEYYSLYATPMFMSWYLGKLVKRPRERRYYNWFGFVFLGLFMTMIMAMVFLHIPLSDTLYPFQLIALSALLLTLMLNVRNFFRDNDPSMVVLMGGMIITTLLLAVQIICIWGMGVPGLPDWLYSIMKIDYISWVLLVMISSMLYSLMELSAKRAKETIWNETLEEMAYVDSLTGIPNRTSVMENMETLRKEDRYAVFFLDVDKLKRANDFYGHKTGDELIRMGAAVVKEAFGDSEGFYGRWGGDEYVAFVTDVSQAEDFEHRISRVTEMKNSAAGEQLAVPLQMSVGMYIHQPGADETPKECMDLADKLMYENKKKRYAQSPEGIAPATI